MHGPWIIMLPMLTREGDRQQRLFLTLCSFPQGKDGGVEIRFKMKAKAEDSLSGLKAKPHQGRLREFSLLLHSIMSIGAELDYTLLLLPSCGVSLNRPPRIILYVLDIYVRWYMNTTR